MQKTRDHRKATKRVYNDVYRASLKVKMKAAQSKSAETAKKEEEELCVETLRGFLLKLIRKHPLIDGKMQVILIEAVARAYIDFHTKYDDNGNEDLSAARAKGDALKRILAAKDYVITQQKDAEWDAIKDRFIPCHRFFLRLRKVLIEKTCTTSINHRSSSPALRRTTLSTCIPIIQLSYRDESI
jgi:hypothetical protein